MRLAVILAILLLAPRPVTAEKIIFLEFLNSDLTFGQVSPNQQGWDGDIFWIGDRPDRRQWSIDDGTYQIYGGSLVHHALHADNDGIVRASTYLYGPGTFEAFFHLHRRDRSISGAFVAPLLSLQLWAEEGDGGSASAHYVLGKGIFDQQLARALGIRQRTTGGDIWSELILTDDGNRSGIAGNHSSPTREAWDGVAWVDIQVPEPPITILVSLALATAAILRRR
jgi:hypothetical protein